MGRTLSIEKLGVLVVSCCLVKYEDIVHGFQL